MKRLSNTLRLFLVVILVPALFWCGKPAKMKPIKAPKKKVVVFVCTGPYARTYHYNPNCPSLQQCRDEVLPVSEAKARVYRAPCVMCNRR